jgi:predicted dehydrogenase
MVRIATVGLGKMGLSHLSLIRAHPEVELVGMCDTSKYLLDLLGKNTGIPGFTDAETMLKEATPHAVIVATPSQYHESIVRSALEQGIHVFSEKPLCLDWLDSVALNELAESKGLVNQVGYHYRFVAAFQEMKRLLDHGAIGTVSHVLAEAHGPVVLRPKGSSWRQKKTEGGGCLYDYAAHPINLLNWYFGLPESVGGTVMNSIFSQDVDDEVYGTLRFPNGISGQLMANWSDESQRKMSVKITAWGTAGKIYADRQECQVYLRDTAKVPEGYTTGWNIRYTTDLTEPVWFYMRGEEYSAQLDYFVRCIQSGQSGNLNSFADGAQTDRTLAMMRADAESTAPAAETVAAGAAQPRKFNLFRR